MREPRLAQHLVEIVLELDLLLFSHELSQLKDDSERLFHLVEHEVEEQQLEFDLIFGCFELLPLENGYYIGVDYSFAVLDVQIGALIRAVWYVFAVAHFVLALAPVLNYQRLEEYPCGSYDVGCFAVYSQKERA